MYLYLSPKIETLANWQNKSGVPQTFFVEFGIVYRTRDAIIVVILKSGMA
jgi:hypothetical protein